MTATLPAIAAHLVRAMRPLDVALRDPDAFRTLMFELGWQVDGLPPEYVVVADTAARAIAALEALAADADPATVLAVVEKAGDVYRALTALTTAPTGVDPAAFLPQIGRRLFEFLLARDLLAEAPGWFATLEALGIIGLDDTPPEGGRPGFTRTRFDWDQIPTVLADPATIPARLYGWGTPDFAFDRIAGVIAEFLHGVGVPASLDLISAAESAALQSGATVAPRQPVRRAVTMVLFDFPLGGATAEVGVMLAGLPAEGSAPPGMILRPLVPDGVSQQVDLAGGWVFTVRAGTDLARQLGVVIRPGEAFVRYPFEPGQPLPSAGFAVALTHHTDVPTVLFGQAGQSRLELASASLGISVDDRAGELELAVQATVDGLAFVLAAADLDGFLGSALGGGEVRVEIPLGLSWSSRTGLDFTAGAGFATTLYPHRDLGAIRFDRIDLAVVFATGAAAEIDARIRASFSGSIGPIAYAVDQVGAQLAITLADGNAGPFGLRLAPLWPTGLGLAIDAGAVRGGGFVSYEPDRGRYVGIVALDVFALGLAAIAILDTRDTAGHELPSPGFSLVLLVAVDLPPIQLGYGFTLNRVGGIAGLNRRLDTAALSAGLRQGTLEHVLQPRDPVRDATTIVANLSAILPVAMGRHVFGPTAVIGWGTPTLITIELAIMLEVPAPVTLTLLGQASIVLPKPDAPIVSLHVDVIGVLDVARRTLAIDASLHDSWIAGFALSGQAAMRLNFGPEPNFALAVGGLNPHFTPPAGFPTLRPVTVALGADDNPRVSLQGYLAITSNSVQFGARAELYAAAGGFNVHGWLGFDALVTLVPLAFRFDFAVGMALSHGSSRIAGVTVTASLTGPNPFHAWGEASLSLLFFDITVPFDATFGSSSVEELLGPADPWPLLHDAIARQDSWSTEQPARPAVSLVAPAGGADLVLLQPAGAATLRQKVVPLNRVLERFGHYGLSGPDTFAIGRVQLGVQTAAPYTTVTDHFVPGDFERLSPSDQLSRDSFERMDAGVRIAAGIVDAPLAAMKTATVAYETRIVDTSWRCRTLPPFTPGRPTQLAVAGEASSVLRPPFHRARVRQPAVLLAAERYTVASTDTLTGRPDTIVAGTRGAAWLALKHAATQGGAIPAGLQVVAEYEVRG